MTIVKAMRPWLPTAIGMPTMAMTNAINSTGLMTVSSDDNMSNDDDDANCDVNDHSDKDDDDDAEETHIGCDVPVCKSCGNFGHRTHRNRRCPDHECAHCRKQGHSKRFCPDVQCHHCDLFGHVIKVLVDCKYKHCIDVDVDWLNILLSVSASCRLREVTFPMII